MCTDNAHWLPLIASFFNLFDALISNTPRYGRHDENLIAHISEVFLSCANSSEVEVTEAYNIIPLRKRKARFQELGIIYTRQIRQY